MKRSLPARQLRSKAGVKQMRRKAAPAFSLFGIFYGFPLGKGAKSRSRAANGKFGDGLVSATSHETDLSEYGFTYKQPVHRGVYSHMTLLCYRSSGAEQRTGMNLNTQWRRPKISAHGD